MQTFADVDWKKIAPTKIEKKRGCVIIHKVVINTSDADFVRDAWNVPNCRTLICKVREVWKGKKQLSSKKRYFVSSLDAKVVSLERFLKLTCGHW